MKISDVKIKKVLPKNGHVGFVSVVIDDWLYLGNIAVFSRLNNNERLRLVFPEKKVGENKIAIFYPLVSEKYYQLEEIVSQKFKDDYES